MFPPLVCLWFAEAQRTFPFAKLFRFLCRHIDTLAVKPRVAVITGNPKLTFTVPVVEV